MEIDNKLIDMKKISLIIIGICVSLGLTAQNYQDALRYGESFPMGDARFTAMSGSFGAVGANLSGISVNPAGSALLKNDVIEFTPGFLNSKTENYYLGQMNTAYSNNIAMPNFGIAFTKDVAPNDMFVSGLTFAFTTNRQQNYDETSYFTAINNSSSLTDDFLRNINNNNFGPAYADLAWETYLVDSANGLNFTDFRWFDSGKERSEYGQQQNAGYRKQGALKEYLFNLGIDFSEKVYLGASLNMYRLRYKESFDFTESDVDKKNYLNEFTYSTDLDVDGVGVGGNFGVILKPTDFFRLGVAAHSPVVLNIYEKYDAKINALYDVEIDGSASSSKEFLSDFDYNIRRPGKIVTSAGFVYKNIAIVNVDYEKVYYSEAQISSASESFSYENTEIKDVLSSANNIKAGAELRYGPYSFRGGFALYQSPFSNATSSDYYRKDISGGIGISNDDLYVDLSWVKSKYDRTNTLYNDYNGNPVLTQTDTFSDNFFLTVGFKF